MQHMSINAHIESISDQLCKAANGDFGFIVESHCDEEVIQKLTILLNFILSVADRSLKELSDEIDERKKLVAELFEIINGRVRDFVFKHDSVRVIQCALKYADQTQRRGIVDELKSDIRDLAESRYAKFLIAKMLQEIGRAHV